MKRTRSSGVALEGRWAARSERKTDHDRGQSDVAHGASCAGPPKAIFVRPVTRTDS